MSLRIDVVAARAYDEMKRRPGANPRVSDARDLQTLAAVTGRIREMLGSYQINSSVERGTTYVFWSEVAREIDAGKFDDLLGGL